jgi:hypothetical protein
MLDADTGRPGGSLARWRENAGGPETQLGAPFVLGPLIGGELYPSYDAIVLVDPVADRVRLRIAGIDHMHTIPGASRGLIAVAGRDARSRGRAVLSVDSGRQDCGVELRGFDLASGLEAWRWAPPAPCSGVFVTGSAGSAIVYSSGDLRALDVVTGQGLWSTHSPICSEEVCNGLSTFRIAADERHLAMTVGDRLVVHSARDGRLLWAGKVSNDSVEELRVSRGRVYLASRDLVCLDLRGREVWRLALGKPPSQIEVAGEILYVAGHGVVRALQRETGAPLWVFGADRFALTDASTATRAVVLGSDGEGAVAYAADRAPSPVRELTVSGRVTVTGRVLPPLAAVDMVVAGVPAVLDADGRYKVRIRLAGGRIAVAARGCKDGVGPVYLPVDARSEYVQDLTFEDSCDD